MNPDIVLKVVGYAVVPLVMAWIGNHLASQVVEDIRRRRMYRGAFIVLVVVGIVGSWLVEWRSDRDHAKEVTENNQAISHLQSTLTATQVQSATDLGYLKGRLDAALDRPQLDMSGFAKALAQSTSGLVREQTQIQSDADLKQQAIHLAHDMRVFEVQYKQKEEALFDSHTYNAEETRQQAILEQQNFTNSLVNLSAQETLEFRNNFLARALTLRDQMITRIGDPSKLPQARLGQLIAFDGMLAGPSPISDAADYLESLAMRLPVKPTTRR